MKHIKRTIFVAAISATLLSCMSTQTTDQLAFSDQLKKPVSFKLRNHEQTIDIDKDSAELVKAIEPGKNQYTKASIVSSDHAQLSFQNSWHSALIWHYPGQGVNLAPYIEKGVLSVDLKVENIQDGALNLVVSCGQDCTGKIRLREWAQQHDGQGWQTLHLSMKCFKQPNADYSQIQHPFIVEGDGKGTVEIKNIKIKSQGQTNFRCPDPALLSTTPAVLNEYWSTDWWMPRHQQKLNDAKNQNPDFVLIGDSITHGWENSGQAVWQKWFSDISSLNLGFSGDRTENVLWRLQHGEVDGISPKFVMIMIGTNNTGHRMENPAYIANGIDAILAELDQRIPQAKVLLLNIFPRGAHSNDEARQNNIKVNQLLDGIAQKYGAIRADFNPAFLQENGDLSADIMPDLLHPNEQGYEIWARQLTPYIEQYIRTEKE